MKRATKTITINGVEYFIHFGFSMLMKLEEETGISFDSLGEYLVTGKKLNNILTLALLAFQAGYRREEKIENCPFNDKIDVANLLDNDEKALDKIMEVFTSEVINGEKDDANTAAKKK